MLEQHERTDANARAIGWTAGVVIVSGALVLFMVWGAFYLLKARAHAPPNLTNVPAVNRSIENKAHVAEERKLLESYAWIDRDKGIVRVPIEKAIEILLYGQ